MKKNWKKNLFNKTKIRNFCSSSDEETIKNTDGKSLMCAISVGSSINQNHPTYLFAQKFAEQNNLQFITCWKGWMDKKNSSPTSKGNYKVFLEFVGAEKHPKAWLRGVTKTEVIKFFFCFFFFVFFVFFF